MTVISDYPFLISENRINLLTILINDSWTENTSTIYYDPKARNTVLNEQITTAANNFYFKEYFSADNSPEINITKAAITQLIKNNTLCADNIVYEDGQYRFISDANLNYFGQLASSISKIENDYLCCISFLKHAMNLTLDNKFTPIDLASVNLGRKAFFNEFRNYLKIVPQTLSKSNFTLLLLTIQDILLEENQVKQMSHWDLHVFHKFYLSFNIDDLAQPYIKVFTRNEAEAAQLALLLIDKDYVEMID